MQQPGLVSVLVALYNHDHYITQCLNSVVQDTYPLKELLIIDDGSNDQSKVQTERWIAENKQNFSGRIAFKSRENRGLTKTLNELLSMAQGEFVILLASDDYLLPGGIEKRVNYLRLNPHLGAVFADCIVINEQGQLFKTSGISQLNRGRKSVLKNQELLPYELVFRWCVPGPVFMARKSVYEKIGVYDENIAVEDWDFYLRLVDEKLLGFLDETVAAYRVNSIGKAFNDVIMNKSMYRILCKHIPRMTGIRKWRIMGYKKRLDYALGYGNCLDALAGWLLKSLSKVGYSLLIFFATRKSN